jgi:two-component system sensor histidine kinase RegB
MAGTVRSQGDWMFEVTPEGVSRWLTRLWWASAAVDGLLVLLSLLLPRGDFPLYRVAPLIAASALAHLELASHVVDGRPRHRVVYGAALLLRIVLLTGLLELSGGPSNPFTVIYAAQVALAVAILGRGWAYLAAGAAAVCYGTLISWHLHEAVEAHHRFVDFPTHLYAMWIAITTLTELATHFAGAASRAIARRERELDDMRLKQARSERLISMTTLAAGAAHELSTPLATIAVTAKELERTLATRSSAADCVDDAHLIRAEVDRCQLILDQMSGRAGGSAAEQPETVSVAELFSDVKARLPLDLVERLDIEAAADVDRLTAPRAGLVQVLLSLLKNSFDASEAGAPVSLAVERSREAFRFVIRDRGPGIAPEMLQRVGEPFFTTKEAGKGFGLGVFLARVYAERCGGSLTLESAAGTTATLTLPAGEYQGRM